MCSTKLFFKNIAERQNIVKLLKHFSGQCPFPPVTQDSKSPLAGAIVRNLAWVHSVRCLLELLRNINCYCFYYSVLSNASFRVYINCGLFFSLQSIFSKRFYNSFLLLVLFCSVNTTTRNATIVDNAVCTTTTI